MPRWRFDFSVHKVDDPGEASGTILYFECEYLDLLVASLEDEGVGFDFAPADKRWLWRKARLRDPDGNRIYLFSACVNRCNPPWRLPGPTSDRS